MLYKYLYISIFTHCGMIIINHEFNIYINFFHSFKYIRNRFATMGDQGNFQQMPAPGQQQMFAPQFTHETPQGNPNRNMKIGAAVLVVCVIAYVVLTSGDDKAAVQGAIDDAGSDAASNLSDAVEELPPVSAVLPVTPALCRLLLLPSPFRIQSESSACTFLIRYTL